MASASRAALIYCENAIRHIIQDCDAYMHNLTFDCATLYLLHPLPYYPRLSLRDAPEEGVVGGGGVGLDVVVQPWPHCIKRDVCLNILSDT